MAKKTGGRERKDAGRIDEHPIPVIYGDLADFKRHAESGGGDGISPLRKHYSPIIKSAGLPKRTIDFVLSTQRVDRDGDTVDPTGWDLEEYKSNPVMMWSHNYYSPPIGRGENVHLSKNGTVPALVARGVFMPEDLDPFSWMIYRMFKEKFLHTVSVGFLPLEWAFNEERRDGFGLPGVDFKKQSLLEFSPTPIPSNADAVAIGRSIRSIHAAKSKGIDVRPMLKWAAKSLDEGAEEREHLEALLRAMKPKKTVSLPPGSKRKDHAVNEKQKKEYEAKLAEARKALAEAEAIAKTPAPTNEDRPDSDDDSDSSNVNLDAGKKDGDEEDDTSMDEEETEDKGGDTCTHCDGKGCEKCNDTGKTSKNANEALIKEIDSLLKSELAPIKERLKKLEGKAKQPAKPATTPAPATESKGITQEEAKKAVQDTVTEIKNELLKELTGKVA